MILSLISLLIYIQIEKAIPESKANQKGPYHDDTSCQYHEDKVRFGGANAGLFLKVPFTTSYPAIFVCRWQDPGGKYLKFRATKHEGLMSKGDPISFYLGNSFQCETGAKFTSDSFGAKQKIGELSSEQHSFPAERIRVSDPLSSPASTVGCLIAWCGRKMSGGCLADFDVEFYDQYAIPKPIIPIVFGLGWMDLLLILVLFCETIAISTFICSFKFKYDKIYSKLYGDKITIPKLSNPFKLKKDKKPAKSKSRSKNKKRKSELQVGLQKN